MGVPWVSKGFLLVLALQVLPFLWGYLTPPPPPHTQPHNVSFPRPRPLYPGRHPSLPLKISLGELGWQGKPVLSTPWLVGGNSSENLQQLREDTTRLAGQPVEPGIQATSELWQRFIAGFPSQAWEGHLLPPVTVPVLKWSLVSNNIPNVTDHLLI